MHLRIVFGGFEESFLKIFTVPQKRIIIIKNQNTHAFMWVMDSSSPSTLITHPGEGSKNLMQLSDDHLGIIIIMIIVL